MELLLQILGAAFIALIAVAIGGFFWVRRFFRRMRDQMARQTPGEITLVAVQGSVVFDEPTVRARIDKLRQAGFIDVGVFQVDPMEGFTLMGLVRNADCAVAAVYHHPDMGVYADVVVRYEDGAGMTVSNAPVGDGLDVKPGDEKFVIETDSFVELYEELKRRRADRPCVRVSVSGFKKEFEQAYREQMAWHDGRGGITREEFTRIATRDGEHHDPEALEAAFDTIKQQEVDRWHEECITAFTEETTMPVSAWVRYEDSLFIVSDTIAPRYFAEYLAEHMDMTEDQEERMQRVLQRPDLTSSELFSQFNE